MTAAARFDPHRHGLTFTNSWPHQPALRVWTPLGRLTVGDAARGLCGGMVFAAADYYHAGRRPPGTRPNPHTPLYTFLVRRLLDSWLPPGGATRYYADMLRGDTELAARTARREWPEIARALRRGHPVPLGIVTARGPDPRRLPHNHQVLAYRFDTHAHALTVWVYDPNRGQNADAAIVFDPDHPERGFTHRLGISNPVRGFFRVGYAPRVPPLTTG